jgi:hypothetical protein
MLEDRLKRLEQQNRRTKACLGVVVAMLALGALAAAAKSPTDQIVTRELVVVDGEGRQIARIGTTDDHPEFLMRGQHCGVRFAAEDKFLHANFTGGDSGIEFLVGDFALITCEYNEGDTTAGKFKASIGAYKDRAGVTARDYRADGPDNTSIKMITQADGCVFSAMSKEKRRASVGYDTAGSSSVELYNADGSQSWSQIVNP